MIKSYERIELSTGLYSINVEIYDSYNELLSDLSRREMTSPHFHNIREEEMEVSWHGVKSYTQAIRMMSEGFTPAVEKIYDEVIVKAGGRTCGTNKTNTSTTSVVGYQPIVPLVLCGIPNNMLIRQAEKIEARVFDLFIDVTCIHSTTIPELIQSAVGLMQLIYNLELCGHKINLHVCEAFAGEASADLICIKIKNSNSPLDLRRISFPLCHTAFTRVICFDWYSKFPLGIYRKRYGTTLTKALGYEASDSLIKKIFGRKSMYVTNQDIRVKGEAYLKQALEIEKIQVL